MAWFNGAQIGWSEQELAWIEENSKKTKAKPAAAK